ncbi:sensor histidine kinase [Candidatus Bathyarchaeota archaeon]|nr:sensor histidine kinase [Candidatus Bathyarchaeota archaeon]
MTSAEEIFIDRILSELHILMLCSQEMGLNEIIRRSCSSLRDIFQADVVAFIPSSEVNKKLNLKPVVIAKEKIEQADPCELFEAVATKDKVSVNSIQTVTDRVFLKSDFLKRNKMKSLFAFSVSLKSEPQPLACVVVGYSKPDKSPPVDSREMEAARLLFAAASSRVYEELQSQTDLTSSADTIREVLTSGGREGVGETNLFKLDAIMEYILQICSLRLGCQVANIWLYDKEIDRLVLARDVGSERDKMLDMLRIGQGITGRAADIKIPVIVESVERDGDRMGRLDWARAGSEIAVPILDINEKDRVLGVLNVEHREEGKLNESSVPILGKYAFLLALAIRNAEALNEFDNLASVIRVDEDMDSILRQCWDAAKNAADILDEGKYIISATLRLYNPEDKGLECKAYIGDKKPELIYTTESLTSVNSWVFNNKKEKYIEDIREEWLEKRDLSIHYAAARKETHSEYCVPLIWAGNVIGTMNFESSKRSGFSFYTRRTIRLASFQIASAIYLWQIQSEQRLSLESAIVDYLSSGEIHEIVNKIGDIKAICQEVFCNKQNPMLAAKTIEDICDWVLAEADVRELLTSTDTCDLQGAVKEIIEFSKSWRQYVRDVKIGFEPFSKEGVYVRASKFWVRKIIGNIVKNAFHALREREVREVRWSASKDGRIVVNTEMGEGFIKVYIDDNGIGLTPHEEKKLFRERYSGWLVSKSIAKRGHGVALLVLRQAIRRHGGDITCKGKKEGGSLFTVFFKLAGAKLEERK